MKQENAPDKTFHAGEVQAQLPPAHSAIEAEEKTKTLAKYPDPDVKITQNFDGSAPKGPTQPNIQPKSLDKLPKSESPSEGSPPTSEEMKLSGMKTRPGIGPKENDFDREPIPEVQAQPMATPEGVLLALAEPLLSTPISSADSQVTPAPLAQQATATPYPTIPWSTPARKLSQAEPTEAVEATPTVEPTPIIERVLNVGDGSGRAGETAEIPVFIDDREGIQGVQYRVTYDPGLLTFKRHRKGDGFKDFIAMHNRKDDVGIVVMVGVGVVTPSGPGVLSRLYFDVSTQAAPGSVCSIEIFAVIVADESGRLDTRTYKGLFQVQAAVTPTNTPSSTPTGR